MHLVYCETKTDGIHIMEIDADRNIRFAGVLWIEVAA